MISFGRPYLCDLVHSGRVERCNQSFNLRSAPIGALLLPAADTNGHNMFGKSFRYLIVIFAGFIRSPPVLPQD